MLNQILESAINNFSLTDLLVFSTFFVFLHNTFGLKKTVRNQENDIHKLESTQDELNEKLNQNGKDSLKDIEEIKTINMLVAVTESFYKYGLISLGKNSKITSHLHPGNQIKIKYGVKEYQGKIHSSIMGRIDGLTKLFKENTELKNESTLKIKYSIDENIIYIL